MVPTISSIAAFYRIREDFRNRAVSRSSGVIGVGSGQCTSRQLANADYRGELWISPP